MTTDIEKVWNMNIEGFTFKIERNKRKDVFLGCITNTNNTEYIDKIYPKQVHFLTLKKAKLHAIEMINVLKYKN